jgi:O-antigen/teichoic acid export membrane protein
MLFGVNIYIKVTALLVLPLLVKNMNIKEFGVYSVALNLLGYYAVIFSGGIKKIATIDTGGRGLDSSLIMHYSIIRFYLLLFGWFIFSGFCYIYFESQYRAHAITIISAGVLYVFHSAWLKEVVGDMKLIASALAVERTVFVSISLYGLYISKTNFVFASIPISILCGAIYTQINNPNFFNLKYRINRDSFKLALRSIMVGLSFLVATLNLTIDQLLVGAMFSDVDLGMYAGISRLFIALLTFAWMFSQIFIPQISKIAENKVETRGLIELYLIRFVLGGVAVSAFGVLYSEEIINIILTEDFQKVNSVFLILMPLIVLAFANIVVCDSMDVYGYSGSRFKILIFSIVVNIVLSIIFGKYYGLNGVALASVISQVFIFTASYILVNKKYKLKTTWIAVLMPIISLIFSVLVFTKYD